MPTVDAEVEEGVASAISNDAGEPHQEGVAVPQPSADGGGDAGAGEPGGEFAAWRTLVVGDGNLSYALALARAAAAEVW